MNNLCPQNVCTGCFACKQLCAKGAIQFKELNGFAYPVIDASLCVDCGLCTKVCPVLNAESHSDVKDGDLSVSYAVWNNNVEDRMSSSSGGAFSALAEMVLKEGGIVFGAAWSEGMQLRHIGIEIRQNLDALRRSKYVQSNTDGIYKEVRQQVKSGRKTLFCGTPCQVAGLLSFLGQKDLPNLITVGVVCHGVPSQRSFDKYISEIEEKEKVKVYDCNFRSKKRGWRTDLNLILLAKNADNKNVVIDRVLSKNVYMNAFLKQYFLRESCYNCPFKKDGKFCGADIMLSDAWSLWSATPWVKADFGKGVSAVAASTEKGRASLKACGDSLSMMERPYSEYASNSGLRKASKPMNNDAAFEYLKTHTWMETQSKYFPMSLSNKMPLYTRLILGENKSIEIKRIVKKLLHR